jgi:hypothetical protein
VAAVVDPRQVDPDDPVPALDRQLVEVALRKVDPGTVDERVEAAVAL